MSGKDLLVALVMVVPTILLLVLIALTLLPPSVMAPPAGSGLAHKESREVPEPKAKTRAPKQAPEPEENLRHDARLEASAR